MELERADGEWGGEVQGLELWEVWEVWGDGEALFTKPLATKSLHANHFLEKSHHPVEFNITIFKLT